MANKNSDLKHFENRKKKSRKLDDERFLENEDSSQFRIIIILNY